MTLGAATAAVLTPSARLLRRNSTEQTRPSVFAAQFSLSHACFLLTYPLAGMLGAVFGPWLLDRMGVQDRRVRGLAMGAASHGVGTSRSLHDDLTEGAFAGLAMGLTALLTSVLVPLVIALL